MPEPEPKASGPNIPNLSKYPEVPELPEYASESSYRYSGDGPRHSLLSEPARKIGWLLGKIANRVEEIRSEVQKSLEDARESVSETGSAAGETLEDAKDTAERKLRRARYKTAEFRRLAMREYPVQLILAAGVAGVLAGAGMRAWKENRG